MQIPIPLKRSPFLSGINEIVSDHDGTARVMSQRIRTGAGGAVNTYKMECPEGENINRPVMRIWRGEDGRVRYRVFDPISAQGSFVLQRLEEGRHNNPPSTTVARPSDPNNSTWYRFV